MSFLVMFALEEVRQRQSSRSVQNIPLRQRFGPEGEQSMSLLLIIVVLVLLFRGGSF